MQAGEPSPPPPPPAPPATESESEWEFFLGMPMWASGISGEMGVGGFEPVTIDVPFLDAIKTLEMAAAATIEARHDRWGLVLDGMYLRMSTGGETPGRLLDSVDVQVEQVLAEAAVSYRLLQGERGYLDVIAGARYIYLGTELNFRLDSAGVGDLSNDLSNAIVDRTVAAIQSQVQKAATRDQARLATLNLNQRADALRAGLKTESVEKSLEERSLQDIIRSLRGLTPSENSRLKQKIESSKAIRDANKALTQAVISERAGAAVGSLPKKAQQALTRAKKQLANAIESSIHEVIPEHVAASKQWVDPFVGLRGRFNLTERFYLSARGDIGGFGVGSELSYNLFGALGYQWSNRVSTELGYRHLVVDYRDGGFVYDTKTSGIFMGLTIKL